MGRLLVAERRAAWEQGETNDVDDSSYFACSDLLLAGSFACDQPRNAAAFPR